MRDQNNKSTGPKSRDGKNRSSENSTTHGLTCKTLKLLPDESQEDFDALCGFWKAEYLSNPPGMFSLIENLVNADWLMKRAVRRVYEAEYAVVQAESAANGDNSNQQQIEERQKQWNLMLRYKTSAENSFHKALRAAEQFEARRFQEARNDTRMHQQTLESTERVVASKLQRLKELPIEERNNIILKEIQQSTEDELLRQSETLADRANHYMDETLWNQGNEFLNRRL